MYRLFKDSFSVAFLAFLIFCILNQISFNFLPSLSSQRFSFSILLFVFLVFYLPKKEKLSMHVFLYIFLVSFFLIYSALLSVIYGVDFVQSSRYFHFIVLSIFSAFLVTMICKSERKFHQCVLIATLLQVLLVFITYSVPEVGKGMLNYLYVGDSRIGAERASGLSSEGGATLSVAISLGALSILRLSDQGVRVFHLLALLLIIFSTLIVGRTGMLVSIFCFTYILFTGKINSKVFFISLLLFIPIFIFLILFLSRNEQFLSYTLMWALSVFSGSDQTLNHLLSQELQVIEDFTVLFGGQGVVTQSGLNSSGSDVGYVQMFYAVGLPLTFLFYISYFLFLVSFRVMKYDIYFKVILVSSLFLLELKEPFIFKYALSFYVLSSLIFMNGKFTSMRSNGFIMK